MIVKEGEYALPNKDHPLTSIHRFHHLCNHDCMSYNCQGSGEMHKPRWTGFITIKDQPVGDFRDKEKYFQVFPEPETIEFRDVEIWIRAQLQERYEYFFFYGEEAYRKKYMEDPVGNLGGEDETST
jgi:hypothetical protein